jgi:hypothetical protein
LLVINPPKLTQGPRCTFSIINQLQREDEDVEQLMNEDDDESDNDEEPMPQKWMSTDFGHHAIR